MLPSGSNHHTLFKNTPSTSTTSTNCNINNGSKNGKEEDNLIDFENLHINNDDKKTQLEDIQIKMIEEFLRTSKQQMTKVNHSTGITEAEFQDFFDRHEFEKKPARVNKLTPEDIQFLETKSNENKQKSQFSLIPDISQTQNMDLLTSPQLMAPKQEDDENLDVEDLLEEIITHKNQEIHSSVEPEHLPTKKENKVSFVSTANERGEMPKNLRKLNDHNNIFDLILAQNQILQTKVDEKHFPKVKNIPETLTLNKSEKSSEKMNLKEQKALIEELVTKYNIKYLETVKKVDKTFAKFCNLKSDSEKSKLTLGPSLYEKSIVLPQIMQQLHKRKMASETIKSMEMKLILDAAGPSTQKLIEDSQISNTSNMTSELLTNPSSSSSPMLVNSTFPTTSKLSNILNSKPIILKTPIIASVKPNMQQQRPNAVNSTKPTISHSYKDQKQTAFVKQSDGLSSSQVVDHNIPDIKPPELLMEDCNKERLIAHTTYKLFESLVRGDFR